MINDIEKNEKNDIMNYVEENNIPGLLLLVDFEKAFDTVSWSFIQKVLQFFNFGPSIQRWIKVFQTNISSLINQSGHLSDPVMIKRGCRQGDPIASYIFIICIEFLAIRLRENSKIKGININDQEYKISQFADDTTMILDCSETSLSETLSELSQFGSYSGLKINTDKTQVILIGSKKYSDLTLCPNTSLVWGKTTFPSLALIIM